MDKRNAMNRIIHIISLTDKMKPCRSKDHCTENLYNTKSTKSRHTDKEQPIIIKKQLEENMKQQFYQRFKWFTWKALEITSSWSETWFRQLQQLYNLGPTNSAINQQFQGLNTLLITNKTQARTQRTNKSKIDHSHGKKIQEGMMIKQNCSLYSFVIKTRLKR
jgi:hypothetical protein